MPVTVPVPPRRAPSACASAPSPGARRPASRGHGSTSGAAALAAAALLACVALLPSCAAFVSFSGPAKGFAPFTERRSPHTGLYDRKGVIHCHSWLSHDSDGPFADIVRAANRTGLDFLVMTDHQTAVSVTQGLRGVHGRTLFVAGAEVRVPGGGSLLLFPLQDSVRYGPPGYMVAAARKQGGIAFIGHAERWRLWNVPGLCGAEIYNLHAAARAAPKAALILRTLLLPVQWVFALLSQRPDEVLAQWDAQLQRVHPFTPIGGNDAHANVRLFGPLGGTIGTYEEMFNVLTTHVLVEGEQIDEASLVEALRRGRSFVCYDLTRDGTGFEFFARAGEPGEQGRVSAMGETVVAEPGLELVVATPSLAEIRVLRDGEVVHVAKGHGTCIVDPAPGVWRVETYVPPGLPWIFSSTIRVTAARADGDG